MASTNGTSSRGTVASRVQAFQNVEPYETQSPWSGSTQRAMSRPFEFGVTVGRGRREDANFASPAGRASRDGNEGVRGDGRPPVGNYIHTNFSLVEEKDVTLHPIQASIRRPMTSFGPTVAIKANHNPNTSTRGLQTLQKPRSLETLIPAQLADSELAGLRARLRSPHKAPYPCLSGEKETRNDDQDHESKEGREILDELDDLLAGALQERHRTGVTSSDESNGGILPQASADKNVTTEMQQQSPNKPNAGSTAPTSPFRSIATSRGPLKPIVTSTVGRRPTVESTLPESSLYSKNVEYAEMPTDVTPPNQSQQQRSHLPVSNRVSKGPSPIKARAAEFEKIQHDNNLTYELAHDHAGHRYRKPSMTSGAVASIRTKIESAHSTSSQTPKLARTPPIPLILPQLINSRYSRSAQGSESPTTRTISYETARQSETISRLPTPPAMLHSVHSFPQQSEGRKVSVPWPFKMNLFRQDKSTLSTPQQSDIVAKHDIEHNEPRTDTSVEDMVRHINRSPSKPVMGSIVKSSQKITNSPEKHDQKAGNSPGNQNKKTIASPVKQSQRAQSSPSNHGQRHEVESNVEAQGDPTQPQTPKKVKLQEPGTPKKSGTPRLKSTTTTTSPGSPFRGRAIVGQGQSYMVEQRYSLSRSRSRAGVKIQFEVRSAAASPDRTDDDHVIIIRANVEPLEEE